VRFTLPDFQKIMELGKLNLSQLRDTIDLLLSKVIGVPNDHGGFSRFQLFKKCDFDQDENGIWYIEINANDDALPLMFEFKERYFTYELWNALKLKSSNQLRMYEILKQYERAGERVITVDELKELLGIEKNEYTRYNNFRFVVLDVCQKALAENTDIIFAYEPTGKKGRGGKVLSLKFTIKKNTNHVDQLSLEDFLGRRDSEQVKTFDEDDVAVDEDKDDYFLREIYSFMTDACEYEFIPIEIQMLYNLVVKAVPYQAGKNTQTEMYAYLKRKYDELNWRASKTDIKSRVGYIKKLIEADLNAVRNL
jgi:hypothetical protein